MLRLGEAAPIGSAGESAQVIGMIAAPVEAVMASTNTRWSGAFAPIVVGTALLAGSASSTTLIFNDLTQTTSVSHFNTPPNYSLIRTGLVEGWKYTDDALAPPGQILAFAQVIFIEPGSTVGSDYVQVNRYNNNIVVFFASDSTGQTFSNCSGGQTTRTCVNEPHPGDLVPLLNPILIASDPNAALPSTFHIFMDSDVDVPEPASWTMMVLGFGLVGLLARHRERHSSAALRGFGGPVHA